MATKHCPELGSNDIHRVVAELARQAGISEDHARKVLDVFNISLLVENINAATKLLSDPENARVLGYSADAAERGAADAAAFQLKLENLRLGTSKSAMIVGSVPV